MWLPGTPQRQPLSLFESSRPTHIPWQVLGSLIKYESSLWGSTTPPILAFYSEVKSDLLTLLWRYTLTNKRVVVGISSLWIEECALFLRRRRPQRRGQAHACYDPSYWRLEISLLGASPSWDQWHLFQRRVWSAKLSPGSSPPSSACCCFLLRIPLCCLLSEGQLLRLFTPSFLW